MNEQALRQECLRQLAGFYTALSLLDRREPRAALILLDHIARLEERSGMIMEDDELGVRERREQWRAEIEARIEEELA